MLMRSQQKQLIMRFTSTTPLISATPLRSRDEQRKRHSQRIFEQKSQKCRTLQLHFDVMSKYHLTPSQTKHYALQHTYTHAYAEDARSDTPSSPLHFTVHRSQAPHVISPRKAPRQHEYRYDAMKSPFVDYEMHSRFNVANTNKQTRRNNAQHSQSSPPQPRAVSQNENERRRANQFAAVMTQIKARTVRAHNVGANTATFGDDVSAATSCALCRRAYIAGDSRADEAAVVPIMLPCGHTHCADCIRRHNKADDNGACMSAAQCPRRCQHAHATSLDSLPINTFVVELCAFIKTFQLPTAPARLSCNIHPTETLQLFCCQCEVPLCFHCSSTLFTAEATRHRNHDIITLSERIKRVRDEHDRVAEDVRSAQATAKRNLSEVNALLSEESALSSAAETNIAQTFSMLKATFSQLCDDRQQQLMHKVKEISSKRAALREIDRRKWTFCAEEAAALSVKSDVIARRYTHTDDERVGDAVMAHMKLHSDARRFLSNNAQRTTALTDGAAHIRVILDANDVTAHMTADVARIGVVLSEVPKPPILQVRVNGDALTVEWTDNADDAVTAYQLQQMNVSSERDAAEHSVTDDGALDDVARLFDSSTRDDDIKRASGGEWVNVYGGRECAVSMQLKLSESTVIRLRSSNAFGCSSWTYSRTLRPRAQTFRYESELDSAGLIHFLGTSNGKHKTFVNPTKADEPRRVRVESSTLHARSSPLDAIFSRRSASIVVGQTTLNRSTMLTRVLDDDGRIRTHGNGRAFIIITLPTAFVLTAFTIVNAAKPHFAHKALRTFQLDGKRGREDGDDGDVWRVLSTHIDDVSLDASPNASYTWRIPKSEWTTTNAVRRIRLIHCGLNAADDEQLVIGGMEFYGIAMCNDTTS